MAGSEGSQYARKLQGSNFDQARIPIPVRKKKADAIVSRFSGRRYVFCLRFQSSLARCFSAGDRGVPNKCADAVNAIRPAAVSTSPIIWRRNRFAIQGLYQRRIGATLVFRELHLECDRRVISTRNPVYEFHKKRLARLRPAPEDE
jgi:hypothetical protein